MNWVARGSCFRLDRRSIARPSKRSRMRSERQHQSKMGEVLGSNEEALSRGLIGSDGIKRRILEGFFEMSNRALGWAPKIAPVGLLWRRTKRRQCRSNSRLGVKKSLPNSVSSRITHRGAEVLECLRFIPTCNCALKKFPQALCIEKESLYFVGDPDTEGSSTTVGAATIRAVDTQSSDGFLLEILLIVSFQESVSIQCPSVLAVGARGTLEQGEPPVTRVLGSENPNGHHEAPMVFGRTGAGANSGPTVNNMRTPRIKRGGLEARYDKFLEKAGCEVPVARASESVPN